MGQVLTQFAQERRLLPELAFFADKSLSKIEEFYAVYRSISDTFAIDDTEFKDIFGEFHNIFTLLDTNNTLLIDGLQLFTAMVLFSKLVAPEHKVEFIFRLFDFNQLRSLAGNDVEFMVLTCCTVTHKLLGVRGELREDLVGDFVQDEFGNGQKRINVSQMKKWAMESKNVEKFLAVVDNDMEKMFRFDDKSIKAKTLFSDKIYRSFRASIRNELGSILNEASRNLTSNKYLQKQITKFLVTNSKLIDIDTQPRIKSRQPGPRGSDMGDIVLKPGWAYGIRFQDVKYFIQFAGADQLVYFVGKIVVLYNMRSQSQRYYLQHSSEVICLAQTHRPGSLTIATSEVISGDSLAQTQPRIHIWNPEDLVTLATISSPHKIGIHLMKYTPSGRYLITCGLVFYSPIVVYSCEQEYRVVYSVSCGSPSVEIACMERLVQGQGQQFAVATMYGVKCFDIMAAGQNSLEIQVKCVQLQSSLGQQLESTDSLGQATGFSPITCCAYMHMNQYLKYLSAYDQNQERLLLTGHENGEVYVWSVNTGAILYQLCVESAEIIGIIPSAEHVLITSNSSVISFWDIDLKKKRKLHTIDVTTLELEMRGYEVNGMVRRPRAVDDVWGMPEYLVGTSKGDFFILSMQPKEDTSLRYKLIGPRYHSHKISQLFSLPPITTHMHLPSPEPLLLFATSHHNIHVLHTPTHTITQTWKLGEPITHIDALQHKQDLYVVAATQGGRVWVNVNFVERGAKWEAGEGRGIQCVRLMTEGGRVVLVVGLDGGGLWVVALEDGDKRGKGKDGDAGLKTGSFSGTVQKTTLGGDGEDNKDNNVLKKIKLNSTPTQITVLEKKMLLVSTEDNNFYLISSKDFHFKMIDIEDSPLSCSLLKHKALKTFYCIFKPSPKQSKASRPLKNPIILSRSQRRIILASNDGTIHAWNNLTENLEQNRLKYAWHGGKCANFAVDHEFNWMYSSGERDGLIMEIQLLKFYETDRSVTNPARANISASSVSSLTHCNLNYGEQGIASSLIEREIEFSTFGNDITTEHYDQHILVRGLENETLSRLFHGMAQQWKIINKQTSVNSIPNISLKIDYVFGIETDNKRCTVLALNAPYLHFVYFVSTLAIVYDPASNLQKIYRGHRYKITCICKIPIDMKHRLKFGLRKAEVYPNMQLIVTGDCSVRPSVHIWNPSTLETLRIINTSHRYGIIHLHATDSTVLTYGVSQKQQRVFSLQLSSTSSTHSLGYRQVTELIYSLSINPANPHEFATTGLYNVTIWRLFSHNIEKYAIIQVNNSVTCCLYRLVEHTDQQQNTGYREQILVGCENGELGLIADNCRYVPIEQKAHSKAINMIAFVNYGGREEGETGVRGCCNKNIKYVVTCAEDQMLRVWSKSFGLQFEQEIRKIEFEQKSSNAQAQNFGYTNSQNFSSINSVANPRSKLQTATNSQPWAITNQKSLIKNMAVQSISPIYGQDSEGQLCLLLATRNGDVIVLKQMGQIGLGAMKGYDRKVAPKKVEKRMSFAGKDDILQNQAEQGVKKHVRTNSKGSKLQSKTKNEQQKSSFISSASKSKLKLQPRGSYAQMSPFYHESPKNPHRFDQSQLQPHSRNNPTPLSLQSLKFILYLRAHNSQITTNTKSEYMTNRQKGGKVLFTHHPRYDIIATLAQDQNLMFWDTQRNVLILSRILGYLAEPTAMKFTKDGEILIIGFSDGRLLFLDSTISKSHQGKSEEKFILPSLRSLMEDKNQCPVLSIEQSQSGDYLAISYNNKPTRSPTSNSSLSDAEIQTKQKSHICIFMNRSRDKLRTHGPNKIQTNNIFENVTNIACQSDSLYTTQNNNKYGMAAHSMLFTQHQGKTYLLIYQQLIDIVTQNRLNYNKDGNYIIWDVNTSTMIANLDQVSGLPWKKIAVPNSVYARYQIYPALTLNQQYTWKHSPGLNSNLLIPHISSMLNLSNHLLLGSVNGDLHVVQASALEYESMLEAYPKRREMFPAKTYPAHCTEITQMEFNQDRSVVYSGGLGEGCVIKWRVEGETGLAGGRGGVGQEEDGDVDIFREVPTRDRIRELMELYAFKQKNIWATTIIATLLEQTQGNAKKQLQWQLSSSPKQPIKNLVDFVQTIQIVDVLGRRAHDMRANLWYDPQGRMIYTSGHAAVVYQPRTTQPLQLQQVPQTPADKQQNNKNLLQGFAQNDEPKTYRRRQLLYMMAGCGSEPTHEITCACMSHDRRYFFTGHNGLMASLTVWDLQTRLRMKTIILTQIIVPLLVRASSCSKSAVVYGVNEQKQPYLMLLCLETCSVLAMVNFLHEKAGHIKDIAYYPGSSHRFATCGIDETLSWRLAGNQLTYSLVPYANPTEATQITSSQSHPPPSRSINLCLAFLPSSTRLVTGTDDGNILFWGQNTHQRRQHTDMVMVLTACMPNLVVSGSRDGSVIVWAEGTRGSGLLICARLELGDGRVDEGVRACVQSIDVLTGGESEEWELADERENKQGESKKESAISRKNSGEAEHAERQLATVNFTPRQSKVLVGTTSGDIYSSTFTQEGWQRINFDEGPVPVERFHDQEPTKAFFFSKNDAEIYEITQSGHFTCRRLCDSAVLFCQKFNKQTIDMLYSPRNDIFFIIFKTEIVSFAMLDKPGPDFTLKPITNLEIKFITHAEISAHEKVLAIGFIKNSDKSVNIEVYDISLRSEIKYLINFAMPAGQSIHYIDFSRNNKVMLVHFSSGRMIAQELLTLQPLKQQLIAYTEWNNRAQCLYDRNTKLLVRLAQLLPHCDAGTLLAHIALIRELSDNLYLLVMREGGVFVFGNEGQLLGQLGLKVSDVGVARLSTSGRLLGVGAQGDRNLLVLALVGL